MLHSSILYNQILQSNSPYFSVRQRRKSAIARTTKYYTSPRPPRPTSPTSLTSPTSPTSLTSHVPHVPRNPAGNSLTVWQSKKMHLVEYNFPQSAPKGGQMGTPKCMNFENHWGSLGFNKAYLLSFIEGDGCFYFKGPLIQFKIRSTCFCSTYG